MSVIPPSPLQDFTFVCPTEIVEFDKRYADFKVRFQGLVFGGWSLGFATLNYYIPSIFHLKSIYIPSIFHLYSICHFVFGRLSLVSVSDPRIRGADRAVCCSWGVSREVSKQGSVLLRQGHCAVSWYF